MTPILMLFVSVSQTFNLPPKLLDSICWVESHHKVSAINKTDRGEASIGLCEMKLGTARWMGFKGTAKELQMDGKVNAYYAGKYLNHLLKRYNGDSVKAIAAYNAGSYRTNEQGLIKNRIYVSKVLKAWRGDKVALARHNENHKGAVLAHSTGK